MDAAPFSARDANTSRAAVEGSTDLPDGSRLVWALSRREFGPMSYQDRPVWDVAYNRMSFLRPFGLSIDDVVAPHLGHTADIAAVSTDDSGRGARSFSNAPMCDGLVAKVPNLVLLTTHADCLPVWLCAPQSGWIGIAHVGWRGLTAGIVANLIESIPPGEREDLVISIGPGISAARYEVGAEVAGLFGKDPELSTAISETDGKLHLDLAHAARLQAESAGVNVNLDSWVCTHDNEYLSSYRRDGDDFAPMAAIISRTTS